MRTFLQAPTDVPDRNRPRAFSEKTVESTRRIRQHPIGVLETSTLTGIPASAYCTPISSLMALNLGALPPVQLTKKSGTR